MARDWNRQPLVASSEARLCASSLSSKAAARRHRHVAPCRFKSEEFEQLAATRFHHTGEKPAASAPKATLDLQEAWGGDPVKARRCGKKKKKKRENDRSRRRKSISISDAKQMFRSDGADPLGRPRQNRRAPSLNASDKTQCLSRPVRTAGKRPTTRKHIFEKLLFEREDVRQGCVVSALC